GRSSAPTLTLTEGAQQAPRPGAARPTGLGVSSPPAPSLLADVQVLEVERPEQPAALAAEELASAPQVVRRDVYDRQGQILDRRHLGGGGKREALARQIVLELVQGPGEQGIDLPDQLNHL